MFSYSSSSTSCSSFISPLSLSKNMKLLQTRPRLRISNLSIGVGDIIEVAHNKVLVASIMAATIGQLSKPFTSAIGGDGFNLKSAIQSGGMPSVHSAAVVAAATSLALERGFSDSIFGMSAVIAGLVMYDAQGVRREVGTHAKILNRKLKTREMMSLYLDEAAFVESEPGLSSVNSEKTSPSLSISEKTNSYTSNSKSYTFRDSTRPSSKSDAIPSLNIVAEEASEIIDNHFSPLNESVGHTEIQVLVGALLGFIVSVGIDTVL